MLQRYVQRVMAASTHDVRARLPLLEVFTMMKPPLDLLQPAVIAAVLRDSLRARVPCRGDTPASEQSAAAGI
jgi:hypothetical protein